MLYYVLFILFLLVLLYLDFRFGRRSQIKNFKTFGFPTRHSDVEIFTDGPSLFKKMFCDIGKAEHHIHMLFYIFRNDDFARKLLDLLERKASEGVEIRILLDWLGSIRFPRKVMRQMKTKGIIIEFCHTPSFPYFFYKLQCRNHRKITVIDGKIGYLGGFNVGKEYVNQDEKLNPWRDCHVRYVGEGVQDLQGQFLIDWTEATREKLERNSRYYPKLKKGKIEHRFYSFEGVMIEDRLCKLLKQANKEIIIGTPYFIPGLKAFEEIKNAIHRGVKVTLIIPKVSDHLFIKEASYRYLRKLLKLDCTVYQYCDGFYHAKVFIIDDDVCSIGTANFDKRSFYLNHEMNCIFKDQNIVRHMKEIAAIDISKSTKLHLEKLNGFSVASRIKEAVAFLISPLL